MQVKYYTSCAALHSIHSLEFNIFCNSTFVRSNDNLNRILVIIVELEMILGFSFLHFIVTIHVKNCTV